MIKKFNIKDDTFIRYEVIGKGPPILLLHTIRNRLEYSYKVSDLLKKNTHFIFLNFPDLETLQLILTLIMTKIFLLIV